MLYEGDPIYMKKGDRLPSLTRNLIAPNGDDISGASGVVFKFELADGTGTPISGSCVIVLAAGSLLRVRYDWGASDTATAGTYNAEFVVTLAGKEMTFPNGDGRVEPAFVKLIITDNVS